MKLPQDFDWKSYLALNPNLRAAGLKNERQARYHYFHYGQKLGYQYLRKKIEETKQVEVESSVSIVLMNDLEVLKKILDEYSNKTDVYEIIFGFQNFSEESINQLKSWQTTNKFLHCYGFDNSVQNPLEILKFLCLYNQVLVYPQMEMVNKIIITDHNFDLSSFYSLKKINFGVLTASWQRKRLTTKYCDHMDYLKSRFVNHLVMTSVIVDSEQVNKASIKKSKSLYFEYPNQPLSNKFNFGMGHFKNKNIDYVMVLGSDNFVDEILMMEFIKIMRNGYDLIGILNSYIYDLRTGLMYSFLGYPKKSHRYKETVGAGRILSKNILSSLNFVPWANGLSKGLDGSMWAKLLPLKFKEYKLDLRTMNGLMLGIKTNTFITDIDNMKNKALIKKDLLYRIKCLSGMCY